MFSIWTRALFLQQRVSLQDASRIPAITEPLFLTFNAHIEIHPVMVLDDLVKAGHIMMPAENEQVMHLYEMGHVMAHLLRWKVAQDEKYACEA
jgi:hypothetical protein